MATDDSLPVEFVPTATSLATIYPLDLLRTQSERWISLLGKFRTLYGRPAQFVSRSPGRVNLIGEHIDYSLYGVLPMAVAADALLAVAVLDEKESPDGSATIKIANINDAKYPSREITVSAAGDVDIDASVHEWTNYFKSGLRGALNLLKTKGGGKLAWSARSLAVLMDGSVPAGGGLSSSAAFVTASALATLVANADGSITSGDISVNKRELTELAIVSERAVGVNSGGMDQSASVLSQLGAALHVTFHPSLSARPVFFPTPGQGIPELCFVVAQSFVAADKHVTGPIHYNLRVVECTLAAAYLNAVLVLPKVPATASNGGSLPHDASPLGVSLRGFHENYFAHAYDAAGEAEEAELSQSQQLEHLAGVVERTLVKEDGYTREEIAETLGTSVAELEKRFMSAFPVRADRFMLRQRALHVFTEARRVLRFLELLEDPDHEPGAEGENLAVRLGALLNASQASCRDLYDCSCPEIDELCALARDAGSYGSRLTGAGWGGCTVHLVSAEKVDAVREALEKGYYKRLREQGKVTEEQMKEAVVVSKPGGGSVVIVLDDKGNLKG